MTDEDRFFERQRQDWSNLRRLGVSAAFCDWCEEYDPRCFLGVHAKSQIVDGTLHAPCERCRRKSIAPADEASTNKKWSSLRAAGVKNTRCHCGEDNPFCLEADHIDGHKSSSHVIGRCINCHLKRTSRQLTEYPPDADIIPDNELIAARNRVRGTIEHLELMAEGLRPIAQLLHDRFAKDFDSRGNISNAESRSEDGKPKG